MNRLLRIALMSALLVALVGCAKSDQESQGPGSGTQTPGGLVPKADCPDCDPNGPSAFEQAGFSSRFYRAGDSWMVAWRYFQRNDINRVTQLRVDRLEITPVYLFNYRVLSIHREVVGRQLREVATIEITQASPDVVGALGQSAQLIDQNRLDRHQTKMVFEMDDLLRPLRETLYSRDYPHGRTVENDTRSALVTGSNLFPRTVPRIYATQGSDSTLTLPDELHDVAMEFVKGYTSETFRHFTFRDRNDDVYWRDGDVWPFYVRTLQGEGVLIRQELVQ